MLLIKACQVAGERRGYKDQVKAPKGQQALENNDYRAPVTWRPIIGVVPTLTASQPEKKANWLT